jgi:hypothetical protein
VSKGQLQSACFLCRNVDGPLKPFVSFIIGSYNVLRQPIKVIQ